MSLRVPNLREKERELEERFDRERLGLLVAEEDLKKRMRERKRVANITICWETKTGLKFQMEKCRKLCGCDESRDSHCGKCFVG